MTGTQFSGWEAGTVRLFQEKVWVVATDDDTELEVWTDVVALARHIRDGVERTFGVRLVNEPVLVGLEL